MPSVTVRAWRIVCTGSGRNQKWLFAIPYIALLALGACTGAVTQEEEVQTEVAVQVGTVMKADLQARVEAYGMVEPEPAKSGHPGGGAKLAAQRGPMRGPRSRSVLWQWRGEWRRESPV